MKTAENTPVNTASVDVATAAAAAAVEADTDVYDDFEDSTDDCAEAADLNESEADDDDFEAIPYVTTLDAAALEHAERELGETPTVRRRALNEIAAWLDANPQVRAKRDAHSVLRFLRGQKFRVERAKHKMTM